MIRPPPTSTLFPSTTLFRSSSLRRRTWRSVAYRAEGRATAFLGSTPRVLEALERVRDRPTPGVPGRSSGPTSPDEGEEGAPVLRPAGLANLSRISRPVGHVGAAGPMLEYHRERSKGR